MYIRKTNLIVLFSAMALLGALAPWASAAVITPGNTPQTDENVLFNVAGLIDDAAVITGITNNTNVIVTFTGDGEILTTPAAGQARIAAADGAFDFLRVEIIGGLFTSLILNLDALADGSVQFTTDEVGSGPTASSLFALSGAGNNFFTLVSDLGGFQSVQLNTDVGVVSVGLDSANQIRIGGSRLTPVVPEPGTLMVWGGLAAISGLAVRRRRLLRAEL